MLAETINGIQIEVNEAIVLQAIEEFLNRHTFKDPIRVVSLGPRKPLFDPANQLFQAYTITCTSELSRLAGETIH